ncbi:MAG: UDP-2,3-diacylglucosamine diphosphatase [Bacteroidales bacterium]|nr:UDP-2,3-diacylglucosamine diphosphatase [Bacteroidales bacterium]
MTSFGQYVFVSDLHLGPDSDPDGAREAAFVAFLKRLPADLKGLFLLGDIFDFWIEYRDVVPRGGVRVLAALAEVAQRAEVWFFPGNHDWWVTDYFEKELGVRISQEPYRLFELDGKRVLIGHGDTLGAHDAKSKLIFHVFRNRACIALLRALHPRLVFAWARSWSAASRRRHARHPYVFQGKDSGLYRFANEYGRTHTPPDLYIFGHLHTPARMPLESGGELIILGDWTGGENYFTF